MKKAGSGGRWASAVVLIKNTAYSEQAAFLAGAWTKARRLELRIACHLSLGAWALRDFVEVIEAELSLDGAAIKNVPFSEHDVRGRGRQPVKKGRKKRPFRI